MAVVKKRTNNTGNSRKVKRQVPQRQSVSLSTEDFEPSNNFFDYNMLIYGQRKIGKTTLALEAEKVYAFFFESNDSYKSRKSDIDVWWKFPRLVDQFLEGNHDRRTVLIDTVRPAYDMALAHACEKYGFVHPGGQNDHGMAWSQVKQEFEPPFRKLMNSKYGFIAIAHEVEAEIKTRSGDSFNKMQPDLPVSAARLIANEVYNIFYYFRENGEQWLQIEGDEYITAGHRMRGHFFTPSGERIFKIPMGGNEKEAFTNLLKAFDNEQTETFRPESRKEVGKTSGLGSKVLKRKLKK